MSGDIWFSPGTSGGFGANSAVAGVQSQGDVRLCSASVRPFGGTQVRLQDERLVCLALLAPSAMAFDLGRPLIKCTLQKEDIRTTLNVLLHENEGEWLAL